MEIVTDCSKLSAFKYIATVEEIIAPLKSFGISYFCYNECTADGALRALLNKGEFSEFYLRNKYECFDLMAANHVKANPMFSGLYLWDAVGIPKFHKFILMAQNFNIYHGCSIVEIDGDIKRSYNFATDKQENYHITELYINRFHILQAFIHYFLNKFNKIISTSNWIKITIPQDAYSQLTRLSHPWPTDAEEKFFKEIGYTQHKYYSITNSQKLTNREIQCLELIVNGACAKEIARTLNLSVRTIDSYIRNIKSKLHCRKISELIIKVLKNQAGLFVSPHI